MECAFISLLPRGERHGCAIGQGLGMEMDMDMGTGIRKRLDRLYIHTSTSYNCTNSENRLEGCEETEEVQA